MRILVLFGPLCLSFRKEIDFSVLRTDTRGLTGSALGFVRIAQELKALGHEVDLSVVSPQTEFEGMRIGAAQGRYDLAVAINEPDELRGIDASFRVCMTWLNDWTFCKVGFSEFVDLYCSPSAAHMEKFRTDPKWHRVQTDPSHPDGHETFVFDEAKWCAIELGCDPSDAPVEKIPARVVYTSSPDRGLHWLLQEWPVIKLAVPEATLHIFYRLEPWIRGFDNTPYFPRTGPERCTSRKRCNG